MSSRFAAARVSTSRRCCGYRVIGKLGPEIVFEGLASEAQLKEALAAYEPWVARELKAQTLRLRSVTGVKP